LKVLLLTGQTIVLRHGTYMGNTNHTKAEVQILWTVNLFGQSGVIGFAI